MQGFLQALRNCQEQYSKKLSNSSISRTMELIKTFSAQGHVISSTKYQDSSNDDGIRQSHKIPAKGLQNTTVAEVLMTKGEEKVGSWLWCHTNDSVYDAVKQMAQNNIGSLVVLKPGEQQLIAGILTERDYLRKVIIRDRSSKHSKVAEIMTNQLITVTSDTTILQAMKLMTENHIRHAPVIDGRIVGMISIIDVVRAVLEQHHGEVKQLNQFIKGDYY